jgi:DNA-binding Lrp family transcriptional regulator
MPEADTTTTGDALLVALQKGLPLERRPFACLGAAAGLGEEAVLARVRDLFDSGVARRFGAVFDSHSLGYRSTLCAADVPAERLEAAGAVFADHPGVTHAYERDGRPNLWFTLTAPAADLPREFERLAARLAPAPVLNLPALRKFKIEAVFGGADAPEGEPEARHPGASSGGAASPGALTEGERRIVRMLQGSLPVSADPFGAAAVELGMDPEALLELLRRWQQAGLIRRIGLILRHRRLGFAANSMCVWPVAAERIEAAGRVCARSPHVTHCYERPSTPAFPYNLYAMIHARTSGEAGRIFQRLGSDAGLPEGRMLWSVREFKKSSPVFFLEPEDGGSP